VGIARTSGSYTDFLAAVFTGNPAADSGRISRTAAFLHSFGAPAVRSTGRRRHAVENLRRTRSGTRRRPRPRRGDLAPTYCCHTRVAGSPSNEGFRNWPSRRRLREYSPALRGRCRTCGIRRLLMSGSPVLEQVKEGRFRRTPQRMGFCQTASPEPAVGNARGDSTSWSNLRTAGRNVRYHCDTITVGRQRWQTSWSETSTMRC
jgi:hypothetical protein